VPPRQQQRTATRAPARASARAPQRGSAIQTGRVSYYFTPGKGHTVGAAGYTASRAPGSVYAVSTPGGQQAEGRVRLPSKTYHRIVLAEFIGTVLIIAAAPIVVPQNSKGAAAQVSYAGPLVRLTAVCVVFFVLALMATGEKAGKVAAAFGGLVLTGAALNAGDLWSALASAIGATKPTSASSSPASPAAGLTATQNEQASGIAPGTTGRAGI